MFLWENPNAATHTPTHTHSQTENVRFAVRITCHPQIEAAGGAAWHVHMQDFDRRQRVVLRAHASHSFESFFS